MIASDVFSVLRQAILVALLSCALVPGAWAAPLTWDIAATFHDGAILSGTFVYDAPADSLLDWQLSTSGGSVLPAFTYNPATSTFLFDLINFHDDQSFTFCTNGCDEPDPTGPGGRRRDLRFQFAAPLTDAGGVIALLPGNLDGGLSGVECFNCAPARVITAGSGAAEVPEPHFVSFMFVVLGSIAVARARFMASQGRTAKRRECSC